MFLKKNILSKSFLFIVSFSACFALPSTSMAYSLSDADLARGDASCKTLEARVQQEFGTLQRGYTPTKPGTLTQPLVDDLNAAAKLQQMSFTVQHTIALDNASDEVKNAKKEDDLGYRQKIADFCQKFAEVRERGAKYKALAKNLTRSRLYNGCTNPFRKMTSIESVETVVDRTINEPAGLPKGVYAPDPKTGQPESIDIIYYHQCLNK